MGKFTFDGSQIAAINGLVEAVENNQRIVILYGGGGRGKTTVIKEFVERILSKEDDLDIQPEDIFFCASTGKAADVLEQSLAGLSYPATATTFHRMLGCRGPQWDYNENNKLPAKIVCFDESSMADSKQVHRLLLSVDEEATIVLIGDNAQLPPVGPGQPFSDLILYGGDHVNKYELDVNWRQLKGSLIANAAEQCRIGKAVAWGKKGEHTLGGELEDDLFQYQIDDPEEIINQVIAITKPWFKDDLDWMAVVPQRSGEAGLTKANVKLQNALNPNGVGINIGNDIWLRSGDRVRQTKNDYNLEVFNGFVGTIVKITGHSIKGCKIKVRYSGGKVVEYSNPAQILNLTLGYIVTVHASQGSGYQYGVIIASPEHRYMWSRSLMYVALTRFIKELHVVGTKKTVAMAIRNYSTSIRNTRIKEVLTAE